MWRKYQEQLPPLNIKLDPIINSPCMLDDPNLPSEVKMVIDLEDVIAITKFEKTNTKPEYYRIQLTSSIPSFDVYKFVFIN